MLPTSIGILQAQSTAAAPVSFAFDSAWDLTSSDALGTLSAKLSAYTGVALTPPSSNPFIPTQNEIVVATGQVFTMASGTTLTSFALHFTKSVSPSKHKIATLSTANPNLNLGEYDHIAWSGNGNYALGADAPLVVIGGGFGGGDDDLGDGEDEGGGLIVPGAPGGGGLIDDPLLPGVPGGGGLVASPSVDINLITLMNTNTGAFNTPLFWLWIAAGLTGAIAPGETINANFEATNSAGTTISTTKTWVTQ